MISCPRVYLFSCLLLTILSNTPSSRQKQSRPLPPRTRHDDWFHSAHRQPRKVQGQTFPIETDPVPGSSPEAVFYPPSNRGLYRYILYRCTSPGRKLPDSADERQ